MRRTTEEAATKLKDIIDRNGPSYLVDEPYKTFQELRESGVVDCKTAAAILHFLVSDAAGEVVQGASRESASKAIQAKCCLKKGMADTLADIFLSLYSPTNAAEWDDKELKGLEEFLVGGFSCIWKGFAVWDAGNGTVDCHYRAEITLLPNGAFVVRGKLKQMLAKNPFAETAIIQAYFEKDLQAYLDGIFREYCECDDYYQPVVEDFEIEAWTKDWCKENGFDIVSCDGDGYDNGYDPKPRFNWW